MRGRIAAAALLALAGSVSAGGFPFGDPMFRDIEAEPVAIELADLSEDGILDLLIIQGTKTGNALVYQGQGDGSFPSTPTDESQLYLDSNSGVAADFNGDGVLDIAALNGACST